MPKFKVNITAYIPVQGVIEVEAPNITAAKQYARLDIRKAHSEGKGLPASMKPHSLTSINVTVNDAEAA